MKHQNPTMNVTLEFAKALRDFLNRAGFAVQAIEGNPNPTGLGSVQMCPEINLPDTGEPLNLMYRFQSVRQPFPVAQIAAILSDVPRLDNIKLLHKTLWPSLGLNDLAGKLMVVPTFRSAADGIYLTMARETFVPPPCIPQSPPDAELPELQYQSFTGPGADEDDPEPADEPVNPVGHESGLAGK